MSAVTLKLDPSPTFWAKASIPVAGQEKGVQIECEFAHMTRDEFDEFSKPVEGRTDLDVTMRFLRGWRGPDAEFSREAVSKLLQNYYGAAFSLAETFSAELRKTRSGN